MKRLILCVAAAVAAFVGVGCNGNNNAPPPASSSASVAPTTQPVAASAKPVNQYCAVDKDQKVDPSVTYLYQGQVIGFCCEDCIPKFKQDPQKYMKDLK